MKKSNEYALHVYGKSYGPFTSSVRGNFDMKIDNAKLKLEAEECISQLQNAPEIAVVDASSGSVLIAGATIAGINRSKDSIEVRIMAGTS